MSERGTETPALATEPSRVHLEQVLERATEVLGSRDKALRWIRTPVLGLKSATPISLLNTPEGRDAVLTVLGRIEHGIF